MFDEIVDSGFTAVRLGVRFSGYQEADPPYTIDPVYLDRVEWAIDGLTERGLTVIVTIHHYAPMEFTHQGATFIDPVFPTGVD